MDVFKHIDYRQFLNEYLQAKQSERQGFSLRNFTKQAGFKSPNYLSLIIQGKRNLTNRSIPKLVEALKLNLKQARYFECLVFYNQAKSESEIQTYFEKLLNLRPKMKMEQITKDQYALFTKKYISVIHQMSLLPGFKENYRWIAERLYPPIKPEQAKEAVKILFRLGFFIRDKNKKLKCRSPSLKTPSQITSLEVKYYHARLLVDAQKALLEKPSHLRDFSTVILPVSEQHLPLIKKKIEKFREEVLNLVYGKKQFPFEDVYQLSVQLFPSTDMTKEEE